MKSIALSLLLAALQPPSPEDNARAIAELLQKKHRNTGSVAAILNAPAPQATPAPQPPPAPTRLATRTPAPPAGAGSVCLDAAIEDNPHYTLITLKFSGDPVLESRPWKASRRLNLTVKGALLPAYNQVFASQGKLISDVALEQLPDQEVRLAMKVVAGTEVTVYKRRTPGQNAVEYAVLFEIPADPVHGGHGPLQWPVHGRLSSKYGWRLHPILHEHRHHSGIDIAVPEGTPIKAAQGGKVVHAGNRGGAGLCVIIEHGNGRRSSYGHCSKLKVKLGDVVKQNQVVALAGSTGMSTGSHVHFSVTENGKQVDPMKLLGAHPGHKHEDEHKAAKKKAKKAKKQETR